MPEEPWEVFAFWPGFHFEAQGCILWGMKHSPFYNLWDISQEHNRRILKETSWLIHKIFATMGTFLVEWATLLKDFDMLTGCFLEGIGVSFLGRMILMHGLFMYIKCKLYIQNGFLLVHSTQL